MNENKNNENEEIEKCETQIEMSLGAALVVLGFSILGLALLVWLIRHIVASL